MRQFNSSVMTLPDQQTMQQQLDMTGGSSNYAFYPPQHPQQVVYYLYSELLKTSRRPPLPPKKDIPNHQVTVKKASIFAPKTSDF